jgi:hypothetical protein
LNAAGACRPGIHLSPRRTGLTDPRPCYGKRRQPEQPRLVRQTRKTTTRGEQSNFGSWPSADLIDSVVRQIGTAEKDAEEKASAFVNLKTPVRRYYGWDELYANMRPLIWELWWAGSRQGSQTRIGLHWRG